MLQISDVLTPRRGAASQGADVPAFIFEVPSTRRDLIKRRRRKRGGGATNRVAAAIL